MLRARESADRSPGTLRLRAGADAPALADRTAAVVGVGAVGSHVADLLARAGVHRLVLCDSETLRPGNCVRHLAGVEHVGKAKTEAVLHVICGASHDPPGGIETREAVRTRADAAALAAQVHLVVDCTGAGPATALVSDAALHSGTPAVTVYLQRDGQVARVDRWPLADGEVRLEEVPPPPGPPRQRLREGGCGDPVSPAPPHAAVTAAAAAARAAIHLLAGRPVPPSAVAVIEPQPDLPYHERGMIV